MREILFRGKRVDNGEWWYGLPLRTLNENGEDVLNIQCWERDEEGVTGIYEPVISETVGQYTGLTVPSGKIFENDIVTAKFKSNGARYNFVVRYSDEKGCYDFDNGSVKVPFNYIRSVRIIGNIHDNPELLKGETK